MRLRRRLTFLAIPGEKFLPTINHQHMYRLELMSQITLAPHALVGLELTVNDTSATHPILFPLVKIQYPKIGISLKTQHPKIGIFIKTQHSKIGI